MMLNQQDIDRLSSKLIDPARCIIGGQQVEATSGRRRDVISPIDGTRLTDMPECSVADVDRAVAIARKCFESRTWAGMPPKERKRRMVRWAELVEAEALELAVLETRDMGMPITMARGLDVAFAIDAIRWYGELSDKLYDQMMSLDDSVTALITRVPLGVVAAILPWNAPAMIGCWKLAPALLVGNSVIVKPSEEASLAVLRIAELALLAGIPEGAIQVVTGGAEVGRALAEHNDVEALSFTGSGPTGRALLRAAADSNLKRVSLELGGKSANIVMADAPDLEMAAEFAVRFMFSNQGQVCEAPSRLLVQRGTDPAFLQRVIEKAKALRIGDPLKVETDLGPVISAGASARISEMIGNAQRQGAQLGLDGRHAEGVNGGSYLGPTIVTDVQPDDAIAQTEIFGPVLGVFTFDTLDEAISIANSTRYGLGASIWSSNVGTVFSAASRLVAGYVNINGGGAGPVVELPFGGFRQSGFGRDRSLQALDQYSDLKSIALRHI